VPYRPRWRFHFPLLRRRLKTGFSFLGIAVVGYLNANLDYLIVGRRFGATDLGYYQAAYSLADELRNRLSLPLQRVLFPAYSLVQDALPRFQNGVTTGLRLLATAVIPLGAGMAATAPEIVRLLYGERWLAVVPLLQILAMNGALRAVFSMCGSVFYARDRAGLALLLTVATLPFVVLGLWIGVRWGPVGVAWAMLALVSIGAFNASVALRLIGLGPWHMVRAIGPALVAAALMAAAVLWIGQSLPPDWGPALRLAVLVPAGAAVYVTALAAVSRDTVRLVLKTGRGLLGRR
jgi:PST family polysaccharide transporter